MPDVLCPVVVGRSQELEVFAAAVAGAGRGEGAVVAVSGEAGIGKSRLAREAAALAERAGLAVGVGRAAPNRTTAPCAPFGEAVLQLLRDRPVPDDHDLAPWLPALAPVLPMLDAGARTEVSPAMRAEALVRLLRRLAGRGALLVLEDLHWADPDTLETLESLAGSAPHEPLACVVSCRDEPATEALAVLDRLRGRPGVRRLELGRLGPAESVAMVRECRPDLDDAEVARVAATADGVPLLVEELLASPGVPRSFRASVVARLGALGEVDRRVLEVAAVLGRAFDWRLLPPAGPFAPDEVATALARAVEQLLVVVDGAEFRFRHALTREAVVETVLPPVRATLARRALHALEAAQAPLAGRERDLAADLAVQAGEVERAARLLTDSGRESLARGALATAVDALGRAVALSEGAGSGGSATKAELLRIDALSLAGRVDDALDAGSALLRRLGAADDGDGRPDPEGPVPEVHLRLAAAAVAATRWRLAATHLDAARAAPEAATSADRPARIAVLDAEIALAAGDAGRARQLAAAARHAPALAPEVACHALECVGRSARLSDLDAAATAFEESIALATAAGLPVWRLRALHELGTIELFRTAGTRRLVEARAAALGLGALSTVAVLELQLTAAAHCKVDVEAGLVHATAALELAEQLGLDQVRTKALVFLAENAGYRCDRDEMERRLADALADAPDDPSVLGFAWGERGTVAFLTGDRARALDELGRAEEILGGYPDAEPANFRGLWVLLLAAGADSRARDQIATARARRIDRAFGNGGMLEYAEAVLAGRDGDPGRAGELARAAHERLVHGGPWATFARFVAAEPALADAWGEPRAWLRDASRVFGGLGLHDLSARSRELERGRRAGRGGATAPTPREAEVLELLSEGLANKEIAVRLHISARTVEKHLESLLRKTGCRSRTQLAVSAGRAGAR